jgi:hypothetical protein
VHFKPFEVAHYQQRRVLQVLAIVEKLSVSGLQILVLAFVFPSEMVSIPDVSVALAAEVLGDVLLKGEGLARLIDGGGMG